MRQTYLWPGGGSAGVAAAIAAARHGSIWDCTGDGELCAFAGADFAFGNEEWTVMHSLLGSLLANIDHGRPGESQKPKLVIERAIEDGVLSLEERHLPGIWETDLAHGIGGSNIGHCFEVDATDEVSLTRVMLRGRSYMPEYERFYKKYVGGAYEICIYAILPICRVFPNLAALWVIAC